MTITVIGAGNIGGTLVRLLTARGHHVAVANARGADSLRELARETGATPVDLAALPTDSDVVIVAVPPTALPSLRGALATLPASTVVVDTGNYVPGLRDEEIEAIDAGLPDSAWSAATLGRPVVKAFNTIAASSLKSGGRPAGAADRIAAPVAGDRAADKHAVIALLDEIGFDGFDAGDLAASWRQQPGTPVYTNDLPLARAERAIGQAERDDSIHWRARVRS